MPLELIHLTHVFLHTVGPYPDHISYTPDCGSLVVLNEGKPGKDFAGKYVDPPGSISIIHGEKTGNPSVQRVEFNQFNNRYGFKICHLLYIATLWYNGDRLEIQHPKLENSRLGLIESVHER